MATTPLTVRRVSLDSLSPDPANARQHGPENLDAIVGDHRGKGRRILWLWGAENNARSSSWI